MSNDQLPADGPRQSAALTAQLRELDDQLLALLIARAELLQQVVASRRAAGLGEIDFDEEWRTLEALDQTDRGPLPGAAVRAVFREILSGCREAARRTVVAYLGPPYSYSHQAALERFGAAAELAPVNSIAAVFEEVTGGQAEFGLVPLENSTDGRIADTLEMFARRPVRICGEIPLAIHHNLLGRGARETVSRVYSKPQALSQCRNWLAKHLPQAECCETTSTTAAAEKAAQDPLAAAIASRLAAAHYGLGVLAAHIEDNPHNVTRFAVIGGHPTPATGRDKTSLMLEITHQPGALADAMAIFKQNQLNLTWIESFPVPGKRSQYLFFIELQGHQADPGVQRAVEQLRRDALRLEVLGSYPQSAPVED